MDQLSTSHSNYNVNLRKEERANQSHRQDFVCIRWNDWNRCSPRKTILGSRRKRLRHRKKQGEGEQGHRRAETSRESWCKVRVYPSRSQVSFFSSSFSPEFDVGAHLSSLLPVRNDSSTTEVKRVAEELKQKSGGEIHYLVTTQGERNLNVIRLHSLSLDRTSITVTWN